MRFKLVIIAGLFILAACDPAATTHLLVHSGEHGLANAQVSAQQIEVLGSMLESKGFKRESYAEPSVPPSVQAKILQECGHLSYWMRSGSEGTTRFTTYAHVCHHDASVEVRLSDFPRFTMSAGTKVFASELAVEVATKIKGARVEIER